MVGQKRSRAVGQVPFDQEECMIEEVFMLPVEVGESITAWRRLSEAEQAQRLRDSVVDEVVGNKCMAGQPVSAAWEAEAREADTAVRKPWSSA